LTRRCGAALIARHDETDSTLDVLRIALEVALVLTSIFLILTILMHKGKGGGLSDMFGGGLSSSVGSSGVAERNLNRITVGVAVVWGITVMLIGLIQKFEI
jgi:preprotein translocase subunit SecG